jgi:hypothetical protein
MELIKRLSFYYFIIGLTPPIYFIAQALFRLTLFVSQMKNPMPP